LREEIDVKQLVKHVSLAAVAFAMTVLGSSSAQAQTTVVASSPQAQTQMDLSAGYQFAHISPSDGSGLTFPYGWYVDFSDTIRPMLAIVGEVGGIYKSQDNVTFHEYTYQGGARLFSAVTPMVTPYGQFLIGGTTAHGSGTSVSAFSLQLGGGMNVKMMDPRCWSAVPFIVR
jgi:hypothetical protein